MDIVACSPRDQQAQEALQAYLCDLRTLAALHIDPAEVLRDVDDYLPPDGAFFLATDPDVVGCAGLRTLGGQRGEIKRMWVRADRRGLGVADALLFRLEQEARAAGMGELVLDTNAGLDAAQRFYIKNGYQAIPRYNDNPDATHFYRKRLPGCGRDHPDDAEEHRR